jgi:hypothetical protein
MLASSYKIANRINFIGPLNRLLFKVNKKNLLIINDNYATENEHKRSKK